MIRSYGLSFYQVVPWIQGTQLLTATNQAAEVEWVSHVIVM